MTNEWKDIIGAASGDEAHVLGKFLYFSLANILIDKETLGQICEDALGIPYAGGKRLSVADAFRSATGDIRERIVVRRGGEQNIYAIYCRDNKPTSDTLSRELVKETLNQHTNQYQKLANICYDRQCQSFGYNDIVEDEDVDTEGFCRRAEDLFELYQKCANRKQVETICLAFLRMLEATKVSIKGNLYFVPKHTMAKVDAFEGFIEELSENNRNNTPLIANSFYIVDDAKQREKMTEEFYIAVKKEIAEYQERADYLIKSGSRSAATMERWVSKIGSLEEKKRHYEAILRRELDGLDDEFGDLKLLSQELMIRARGLRIKKAAYPLFFVAFKEVSGVETLTLSYFYDGEEEQFSFYRIPKALFTDERFYDLSIEGKTMYGLMLNRMSLSKRNNWRDRAGRIYIHFTLEEAIRLLHLSKNKVVKVYKELIAFDLIERVKQGQGHPARIYVKNFVTKRNGDGKSPDYPQTDTSEGYTGLNMELSAARPLDSRPPCEGTPDFPNREVKTGAVWESRLPRIDRADFLEKAPSNTEINHTEFSDTDPSIYPPAFAQYNWRAFSAHPTDEMDRMEQYREQVKENIDFERLLEARGGDSESIEGYVELMVEVCCSKKGYIRIGGEPVPTEVVKDRFLKLRAEHILYVLDSLNNNTTRIGNIKTYTLTALYNAPVTISQYYMSMVNHDMAQDSNSG